MAATLWAGQVIMLDSAVDKLCHSFEDQCRYYNRLWEITKRATGSLAMSRGDFSSLLLVLNEKEQLLQLIVDSKTVVADEIQLWMAEKHNASEQLVNRLNSSLDGMETVIKKFLAAEKQLEKQIIFYRKDPK